MVHATNLHQVEVGLTLAQRSAEMLRQPSESLARYQRFARDVSSRRGILQHREVRIVVTPHGVGTQTLDLEVAQAISLNLGDIDSRIDIEEVGRRTVSLVTNRASHLVSPFGPSVGEHLEEQVGHRLAIVLREEAVLRVLGIEESRQVIL